MLQFLFLAFLHCTFATEVMFPMLLPIGAKNRITHEGYDQLKFGMSLKEVEKTLGGPAGDYGPGKGEVLEYGGFTIASYTVRSDPKAKRWLAQDIAITVCFDKDGRVKGMGIDSVYRPYGSLADLFYQNIGLKQRKPYPAGSFNGLFKGIERDTRGEKGKFLAVLPEDQTKTSGEPETKRESGGFGAGDRKKLPEGSIAGGFGRALQGGLLVPSDVEDKLQLSEDQKKQIAKIEAEFAEKHKKAVAKVGELMGGSAANFSDLRKIAEERLAAQDAAKKLGKDYQGKVIAVLNAEQKKTYGAELLERPLGGPLLPAAVRDKLGLTAAQRKSVVTFEKEFEELGKENRRTSREGIDKASGTRDIQELSKALQLLKKVADDEEKSRKEYEGKVKAALTDEQKKMFEDLKK